MEDAHPRRWYALGLLAVAELLAMSLWFAGTAVAPLLQTRWSLDTTQVGWVTAIVQLGFVVGTASAAVLNLADIVPSRYYVASCATLGALANGLLLVGDGFGFALASRFFTGFFLAGVYPPAMKMAATWFRARRGLAIGVIVGALTIGKALPFLVKAFAWRDLTPVIAASSLFAIIGAAIIAVTYRDGPYPFASRPFSWGLVGTVVRTSRWRLATGGYLGHMFELYSFWAWIPAFLAASAAASRRPPGESAIALTAFLVIAFGALGCVWGGVAADRRGRERLITIALAASGTCALLAGAFLGLDIRLTAAMAAVWSFFVIADSAQFSALVTEAVPAHAVGTALTTQTCLGFLLTLLSIQLIPPVVERAGWGVAFGMLALGPVLGILAIRSLARLRGATA
ncbi:MAG TPA: MFS transporter [Gemmatimonadaceae bacterium]|nr:MFS transporter [Gemmatimonadaceae bacterium]